LTYLLDDDLRGRTVNIFLDVPHQLIRDSLLATLEPRYRITDEAEADVALKDLCSYAFPYPEPPSPPTLALIDNGARSDVAVEVLRLGYRGYLGVEDGVERLEGALKAIVRGENWAERHVLAVLLDPLSSSLLTQREAEVYALVRNGYSNKDAAHELGLSVNTVKVHVSRLLLKQQCKTRNDLILRSPLNHE